MLNHNLLVVTSATVVPFLTRDKVFIVLVCLYDHRLWFNLFILEKWILTNCEIWQVLTLCVNVSLTKQLINDCMKHEIHDMSLYAVFTEFHRQRLTDLSSIHDTIYMVILKLVILQLLD